MKARKNTNPTGMPPHPRSTHGSGPVVTALLTAGFSASLVATIVLPIQSALPELVGAERAATAWAVTVTLLASAVATPIAGKLGDMYGRRRVLLALLALQVAGSVIAALSLTIAPLIVGRALQGFAMGAIPLGIAIMRDALPARLLGPSIGLMSATIGIGGALGLPLAGVVVTYWDWHTLFWISGAVAVVSIVLVRWLVPESVTRAPGAFDIAGGVMMAVGLTCLLLALSQGNAWGWASPATLGWGGVGAVVLVAWGWWELRIPNPIADLRLAAQRTVLLTNLTSAALSFSIFAGNIIYPQLLAAPANSGFGGGLSLQTTGLVLLLGSVALTVASPIAGRLIAVIGPRMLLVLGGLISATGYAIPLAAGGNAGSLIIGTVLMGVAAGTAYAAMPTLIMRAVPLSDTGAATGFNALLRAVGNTIAAAAIGAVYAASTQGGGAQAFPTDTAFTVSIVIALSAGLGGALIAVAIPRQTAAPAVAAQDVPSATT